jgi:hypothetical protein
MRTIEFNQDAPIENGEIENKSTNAIFELVLPARRRKRSLYVQILPPFPRFQSFLTGLQICAAVWVYAATATSF